MDKLALLLFSTACKAVLYIKFCVAITRRKWIIQIFSNQNKNTYKLHINYVNINKIKNCNN